MSRPTEAAPGCQIYPDSGPPKLLCSTCENLELENMLHNEVYERPLGRLFDHNNPACPLCDLVSKAICRVWGDEWSHAGLCSPPITSQLFIQSRSPLSVKKNGHVEHPEPRLLLAIDQKPPSFQHQQSRVPIREVDRIVNRFIIAEIESLPEVWLADAARIISRRAIGSRVNIPLVKHWLEECKKHKHSKKTTGWKDNTLFKREHPFRIIDVLDERLLQTARRCEYVALSYVWGRIPTILAPENNASEEPILLATQKNVKDLSAPKGLSESRRATVQGGRIPRTVRDAMELTRRIGMRYLWVDTLCILQDDENEKSRLIGSIDDVYDNATVTVIAADGSDANAGLRGISSRIGNPIEPTKIVDASDGATLNLSICLPSLCEEVRRSTWNTRGWTFQEQCLSRRCLYFTAEETFFNCSEVQWREGYEYAEAKNHDIQIRTGPAWWGKNLRKDLDPTPYHYLGDMNKGLETQNYQRAVQNYSRKSLTFEHDVFNAFEGIFNRFKRSGDASELSIRQTQGIPPHLLFQAILWFPSHYSRKRICGTIQPRRLPEQYSTWSWASWVGPIDFVFADSLWLSRNISRAPEKRMKFHVPIACWHYGDSDHRIWSHDTWKNANEAGNGTSRCVPDDYLGERTGINVNLLLEQSLSQTPPSLSCGELGFFGPYLPSSEFRISAAGMALEKSSRVAAWRGEVSLHAQVRFLEVSALRGEFRFDDKVGDVDELVAVVAANTTLSKTHYTQSILLGLTTHNGVSTRVGVGFIYFSEDIYSLKPQWQYRFFRVQ